MLHENTMSALSLRRSHVIYACETTFSAITYFRFLIERHTLDWQIFVDHKIHTEKGKILKKIYFLIFPLSTKKVTSHMILKVLFRHRNNYFLFFPRSFYIRNQNRSTLRKIWKSLFCAWSTLKNFWELFVFCPRAPKMLC